MRELGESPLSDRWYIYKDGQSIGPLTAAEIRDALRDGTFDPFDLVSRDGSSVRRELVEVDEIFFNSKVVYDGAAAAGGGIAKAASGDPFPVALESRETAGGPGVGTRGPGAGGSAESFDPNGGFVPTAGPPESNHGRREGGIGQGHLALADVNTAGRGQATTRPPGRRSGSRGKRDAKRYQLIDAKGRQLGPLAASEIQSLFYKGVLDKSVQVLRQGSSAKVPVAKFVAVYAENARPSRPPRQGAHPVIRPPGQNTLLRMAMVQQSRMLARKDTMTIIALLVGIALLFLAGVVAYKSGVRTPDWFTSKPPQQRVLKQRRPLPDQVRQQPVRKQAKKWVKQTYKQPAKAPAKKKIDPRQKRFEERKRKVEAEKRNRERLAELERARKTRVAAKKPFVSPVAVKPSASPPVAPPKKQAAVAPAAPASSPAPAAPKGGGSSVGSLANGQTVSGLGPLSYDKTEIEICEGSCNVTFVGAGGAVQVSFFKGAYGDMLMKKNGPVYISGLVRKKGKTVKIILSGVK